MQEPDHHPEDKSNTTAEECPLTTVHSFPELERVMLRIIEEVV